MSVLVKGMEMPKNCFCCSMSHLEGERLFCRRLKDEVLRRKVDPDCPLIELPPHGRLIDADAFKAMLIDALDDARDEFIRHDDFLKAKKVTESLLMDIDEVPTVIEAEEG